MFGVREVFEQSRSKEGCVYLGKVETRIKEILMDAQQQIQEKNIPLQDGKVDVDAWAESLGYRVENDQLMDGDFRAVAISPGYGAGWSTWNDFSPLDPVLTSSPPLRKGIPVTG